MYRYWTGTGWTASVTPNPQATPPPMGAPLGPGPGQATGRPQPPGGPPSRRSAMGWWLGGLALLVAIGVTVWFVAQGITRVVGGGEPTAGSNPSQDICPAIPTDASTEPPPQRNDGRVHGGKLSYPMLGSPWGPVTGDNRVPFGREVAEQVVMVEEDYNGLGSSWVASVLVGELVAGDGFFGPKEGAEIVMRCVVGRFYADAVVSRDDQVSKAITIDGHEAWLMESHLGFNIPGLRTTGELAIVVIVDTGADSASLYYASIPDTVPELVDDARAVIDQLTVED